MFLEHYGLIEEPFSATPKLFLAASTTRCIEAVSGSGATRKTALPHELDAPPSIESAVFPALVPSPIVADGSTLEEP